MTIYTGVKVLYQKYNSVKFYELPSLIRAETAI